MRRAAPDGRTILTNTYRPARGPTPPGARRRLSHASSGPLWRLLKLLFAGLVTTVICWGVALLIMGGYPSQIRALYALISGAAFVLYFGCASLIGTTERPELQDAEVHQTED
jgi:hypothetical protein